MRSASRAAPAFSALQSQLSQSNARSDAPDPRLPTATKGSILSLLLIFIMLHFCVCTY